MRFKVCIVGDPGVGKTSLLNRYVFNSFDSEYRGTTGATLRYVNAQEPLAGQHRVEAATAFFELMGERAIRDRFKEIFFWGTQGFLAVADTTRPATVRSLATWIRVVRDVAGDIPYRILVNKADPTQHTISPEATALLLDAFPGVPYLLTIGATGQGVERAFEALLDASIGTGLAEARVRRRAKLGGDKLLAFAKRRGTPGLSKREILATLQEADAATVLQEVGDLQALGLATVEETGPASFLLRITPKAEREPERALAPERVRGWED